MTQHVSQQCMTTCQPRSLTSSANLNSERTNSQLGLTQYSSLQSKSKSIGKERPDANKVLRLAQGQVQESAVGAVAGDCLENKSLLFAQSLPLIRAGLEGTAGFCCFLCNGSCFIHAALLKKVDTTFESCAVLP